MTERAQSGSYLLRDPQRMGRIIQQVVQACAPTPVTAKIRLGCSREMLNAIEVAQVVESAGAAALTVHGRTAADFFRGAADWHEIARIRPYLKRIPLIGNGDLVSAQQVVDVFRDYAIDGVMVARACLGRPWLFRQIQAALRGEPVPADPTLDEQRACLLRHYGLVVERFGEQRGTMLMRKYACCYAQGLPVRDDSVPKWPTPTRSRNSCWPCSRVFRGSGSPYGVTAVVRRRADRSRQMQGSVPCSRASRLARFTAHPPACR